MKPLRSTELDLQFAAGLSPWWLLVLLPLAAGAVWLLYRRQYAAVARAHALGLTLLRGGLVLGLVVLLFRPSLVFREILTYPGRVVVLVDDSASMRAADTGYTPAAALRLHRRLRGAPEGPAHALADRVAAAARRLQSFRRATADLDRASDRFWHLAEEARTELTGALDEIRKRLEALPAAGVEEAAARSLRQETTAARAALAPFFQGATAPGEKAWQRYRERLVELEEALLQLQAELDRRALSAGAPALEEAVAAVRATPRAELARELVATLSERWAAALPGQFLRRRYLSGGPERSLAAPAPEAAEPPGAESPARAHRPTDIPAALQRILQEESDFPLTAVLLVSDGRDLSGTAPGAAARELSRRQVPLFAAACGSEREPHDLAVVGVSAPPLAVQGRAFATELRLKTSLPSPRTVGVGLHRDGATAVAESPELGGAPQARVRLPVSVARAGRYRWTARVESQGGEVVPVANNRADLVVHVRPERTRVLFLDWRPRWETRFALNILQRLTYIDLNDIIVVAQEGARLRRGVERGTWPQDAATLAIYDLVVVGQLPEGVLSPEEWGALRAFVEEEGGTLCLLGGGAEPLLPELADLRPALLPVAAATTPARDGADSLRLTRAGAVHPLTRALAPHLGRLEAATVTNLTPPSQSLLVAAPGGAPLVTCRFAGRGRVVAIQTDRLWKILNPTQLAAHADLYLRLATWSVEGGAPPGAEPALVLDQHVLPEGEAIGLWLARPDAAGEEPPRVEAVRDGEVVATARAGRARPGASLAQAIFPSLPAGEITFRLAGRPAVSAGPLHVLARREELHVLARDDGFLGALAGGSGGRVRPVAEAARFGWEIEPRERVETRERRWRLWDAGLVLAALFAVLTAEWIWRKLVGLV